jgi:hypothetical protein
MDVVVSREVCGLLGCGDKVYESLSPGNDVIHIIHSSPRIHRGGFLSGPIWVSRIPLGGFIRHVELGNVIIRRFGRTGFPDAKTACHSPQNEQDVECCVGTLKDGYIRNIPLPRVPQIQSARDYTKTTQSQVDAYEYASRVDAYEYASGKGNPLPDYLPVSSWIPTLPKLGRLIGFSQRIL